MGKYKYSDAAIKDAVSKTTSVYGVMRELGIRLGGGNHSYIKRRIAKSGADISHFERSPNRGERAYNRRQPADVLIDRSETGDRRTPGKTLTRALVEVGRKYRCEGAGCEIASQWIGNRIVLEVDHKDGNWLNDKEDNLAFLCPNCHAVKTASGERKQRRRPVGWQKNKLCATCGKRIWLKATTCRHCRPRGTKIQWPPQQILAYAKQTRTVSQLARKLGVSDSAIHKRLRKG